MITPSLGIICLTAALLFLLVSKFLALKKLRIKSTSHGCNPPPVVPWNDPLGLIRFRQFLAARREKRALPWMIEVMDSAGQDVNTAKDKMLGHSFIWTRDVENARALFTSQAGDFDIDVEARRIALPVIGSGIFNTTGEAWKESRAFLRPYFAREQVSSLDLEEKHFQAMLSVIGESEGGWTSTFDIQPLIFNFTLDVATDFLFGTSANSQTASISDESSDNRFQHHWDSAATFFEVRAILRRYCWLYQPKKFRDHCNAIQAFADKYVQAAIIRKQKDVQPAKEDQKEKFVVLNNLVDVTTDRIRLRHECLNILGASRTSTAALIQWVFFFLARHPSTFDKLREVILAEFGEFENRDRITYESLKHCRFLQCCINEVFRMSPVIPIQTRIATRDTTLPKGGGSGGQDPIFIPKNTEIRQVYYAMCMRKDIWGEDAATFRPERFEDRKLSSEWTPFGAGPRICIGRKSPKGASLSLKYA